MHLLLVEDDVDLGEILTERLKSEGFTVDWQQSLSAAKDYVQKHLPELCILDVNLPDGSGFDLARDIRSNSPAMPLVFLTAMNTAENRLMGYELGAAEYIPKPFHFRELLIRLRHVVKEHLPDRELVSGQLRCNLNAEEAFVAGKPLDLNVREGRLLIYIVSTAPRVVRRDELIAALWSQEEEPHTRTIDNMIVRIRQKLGDELGAQLATVRGQGYRWTGTVDKNEVQNAK